MLHESTSAKISVSEQPQNHKGERFKLDCHRCRRTVEIPVENVQAGVSSCPLCDVRLTILWNAVHAQAVGLKRVSA